MPRYYFHLRDGTDNLDTVGTELADDAAALEEAMFTCSDKMRDLGRAFWEGKHLWKMDVTDQENRPVYTLHFSGQVKRHTAISAS